MASAGRAAGAQAPRPRRVVATGGHLAADAPSPARWQLAQSGLPFEADTIHLGRRHDKKSLRTKSRGHESLGARHRALERLTTRPPSQLFPPAGVFQRSPTRVRARGSGAASCACEERSAAPGIA